jgi:hypothetical protein
MGKITRNNEKSLTYKYVVELWDKVWLADWKDGDPPRTLVIESARVFESRGSAQRALNAIKGRYPFRDYGISRVQKITVKFNAVDMIDISVEKQHKVDLYQIVKQEIIKSLKSMARAGLNEPFQYIARKKYYFSDIAKEIENGSDVGDEVVKDIIALTIDLVMRGKRKIKNYLLIDETIPYDKELSCMEVSATSKKRARKIAYRFTDDKRWLSAKCTKQEGAE